MKWRGRERKGKIEVRNVFEAEKRQQMIDVRGRRKDGWKRIGYLGGVEALPYLMVCKLFYREKNTITCTKGN